MMNAMITKMIKQWKNKYFKDVQCVAGSVLRNPKIIYPLEKSHEIVFNLALSCNGFSNLSYFPLFRNISPMFLSCASKEFSMVSIWSLYVFEFVSRASWMDGPGNCPHWFLISAGHLQSKIISQRTFFCGLQILMRSWCNLNWREILSWLGGSTHEAWWLNLFALPDLQRVDPKNNKTYKKIIVKHLCKANIVQDFLI